MKTAPTLGPAPLVPQPQHGIDRSYISALRPADRMAFAAAEAMMRELLPQQLDLAVSWSLQSKEAIKSLVDKIAQSYPSFRDHYEGAWPLFYYVQQHLTKLRSERRARERQMNRTQGPRRHTAQKSAHLPPQPSVAVATTTHRRINGSCKNVRSKSTISPCPRKRGCRGGP
ncbi:hypothetical protein BD413DRAFT_549160 [Trametes elegans]|nr:hypothetical protein BD413DRAFT_549160 [Trametes elegans]